MTVKFKMFHKKILTRLKTVILFIYPLRTSLYIIRITTECILLNDIYIYG